MEGQRERYQILATKLYDAAIKGDTHALLNLLQEDPLILHWCSIEKSGQFAQSPLHVAANFGHLEFAREVLNQKPELAEELDHTKRWSPLHMASAKGHLDIAKALLAVNPDMCLARDLDGRNPVHIAAITGQVHVLDELLRVMPQATRERTNSGGTALHLCVKHSHTQALMFMVNVLDDGELLNSKDNDGCTALHLAVAAKQLETVKFLLTDRRIEINTINRNALTAVDTFIRSRKHPSDREIWHSLKRAQAINAKDAMKPRSTDRGRLESQRSGLMVVASLIATMAFTVGVNPPGGVWQDNDGHNAGTAIMADVNKGQNGSSKILFYMNKIGLGQYDLLLIINTIGLISSMSVILFLISGLPFKRLFVGIFMITMWIAVTATTLSYTIAVNFLASAKPDQAVWRSIEISLGVWLFLMILLLIGHVIRFLVWLTKKLVVKKKTYYPIA